MKKLWLLAAALIAAASLVGTAGSSPATGTFDRGLPTANLNNAAGADRSNVAWSLGNDYVTGDDFTIGSTGETWVVTHIRTWNVGGDASSNLTLYFGDGTGAIAPVTTGTSKRTPVTYAGGGDYQTTSGAFRQLWQNDFDNLGLTVTGGQTYDFAVDGTPASGGFWFNHASNAAKAGSTQDGADGTYLAWAKNDLSTRYVCDSGAPSGGDCNGGWDKSSDIDVQVFATQVATNADSCKDGGWQGLIRSDGSTFKNQGDCVQYANTGK